jgi:DNA primase
MSNIHSEYEPVLEIIEEVLGEPRSHYEYKKQISFDCPVCSYEIKELEHGDGKGNLEVNYKRGVFKCWSCGETHETHGSIFKLIKEFGTKKQLKKYQLLKPEYVLDDVTKVYRKVELPKEYVPFRGASEGLKLTHFYKRAINYLRERNVTDETINKYNIGFCYEGEYHDRIIIPSYDKNDVLNYFTARSYESKPFLKYKNPEAQKEIIIYNENLINWFNPVYICEGPFDSLFLPNSIPMLGKVMSEQLFATLYNNALKIIIVLDGDAYENSEKLYHKLNGGRLYGKVWLTKLPIDKDIADLKGDLSEHKPFQLD